MVRDQHLNTIDVEEELHRAAWDVEAAARHHRALPPPGRGDPGA
jgi:hypothetical protein